MGADILAVYELVVRTRLGDCLARPGGRLALDQPLPALDAAGIEVDAAVEYFPQVRPGGVIVQQMDAFHQH